MTELSNEQKTERVIQWLTKGHLFSMGGYEYDHAIWKDRLFVAELDDAKDRNRTIIKQFAVSSLPEIYDQAELSVCAEEDWPDEGEVDFAEWGDAMNEVHSRFVIEE